MRMRCRGASSNDLLQKAGLGPLRTVQTTVANDDNMLKVIDLMLSDLWLATLGGLGRSAAGVAML